jgi:hypothetical protein
MKFCPFAPYTMAVQVNSLDECIAIVTLNNLWQAQGCKISQPSELMILGDYC